MPDDSVLAEFLRWLDVIPGRHWLVVGLDEALAGIIRADYRPSRVTEVQPSDRLPFAEGSFDVVVASSGSVPSGQLVEEMRRVLFPTGTVGLCVQSGSAQRLESLLGQAGLHAVQTHVLNDVDFARGAR